MNLLSSVLPGFREVRAPLISGYLWLFFIWLVLGDALPQRQESEFYADLFQLGDRIGRIGLALALSIAAYVLGSLVQAVFREFIVLSSWARSALAPERQPKSIQASLERTWEYQPRACGLLDRAPRVVQGLDALASRETDKTNDKLKASVTMLLPGEEYKRRYPDWPEPKSDLDKLRGQATVSLPGVGATLKMPRLTAEREIFGERTVILSRLMETTPFTGSTIDRLQSESELRFALAWPLFAVILAVADRAGNPYWLFLLPVPILLLGHGILLHREASLALVDALRVRTGDELANLTPAYRQFAEDGEILASAIPTVPLNTHAYAAVHGSRSGPSSRGR